MPTRNHAHRPTITAVAVVTASLLVGALLSGAPNAVAAAQPDRPAVSGFTDVPDDHPFAAEIAWIAGEGIATGWPDNTFRPTATVTRQEIAAFLHRYADPGGAETCTDAPFVDVAADHPFCVEIDWLATEGLADGWPDGTFRPTSPVTRQEMAALLHRFDDPAAGAPSCPPPPFTDVPATHPFCEAIAWLKSASIGVGQGTTFQPTAALRRQETAALLHRYDQYDAAPVPSPGCGTSTAVPVVEERRDLTIGASPRWFLHTVPSAHDGDTPLPLVLDFHGLGEGASIHTVMSEASGLAEQEGFVVAFPHGRFSPVRWDAVDQTNANEDLLFVDAIVETLGQELCIDESRTYAMGLSFGAIMTSLLTCTRSGVFAAVAPVAGVNAPAPCAQERAVPLLTFHGTEDAILPFANFPPMVETWAARNGCDPTPTDTVITPEVTHRVYDCPKDAAVEFYILPGSGHVWPGSEFSRAIEAAVGYTTFDIHATEAAWAFFERFDL